MKTLIRVTLLLALVLLHPLGSRAEVTFEQRVSEASMTYTPPPGFKPVPVRDNPDVDYHYAIKSDNGVEIRYLVRPLARDVEEYRKSKEPGSNSVHANPNQLYHALLLAFGANISGTGPGQFPVEPFPAQAVRQEFGADSGLTSVVRLKPEGFGAGYSVCVLNAFHKDDVADAFVFFLAKDPELLSSLLHDSRVFHALRFRDQR